MALSTANSLSPSLSSKLASKSSDSLVRFQTPNVIALRSSFVLPGSIELKRSECSALRGSGLKSRICASAAEVMDQSVGEASSNAPTLVDVDLGNRSYPIYIGPGLLDQPELLQRYCLYAFIYCSDLSWLLVMLKILIRLFLLSVTVY